MSRTPGPFPHFTLLALAALAVLAPLAGAATLYGTVYDGELEPARALVVLEGEGLRQSRVAADGNYEFDVPGGTYVLTATLFERNALSNVSASDEVVVPAEGALAFDVVVFGADLAAEVRDLPDVPDEPTAADAPPARQTDWPVVFGLLALLAVVVWLALRERRKRLTAPEWPPKKAGPGENAETKPRALQAPESLSTPQAPLAPAGTKQPPLPPLEREHRELLKRIEDEGGRTTQKALRKKVPWSEARVSLLLSDLEARGRIHRRKRGRENLVLLAE